LVAVGGEDLCRQTAQGVDEWLFTPNCKAAKAVLADLNVASRLALPMSDAKACGVISVVQGILSRALATEYNGETCVVFVTICRARIRHVAIAQPRCLRRLSQQIFQVPELPNRVCSSRSSYLARSI